MSAAVAMPYNTNTNINISNSSSYMVDDNNNKNNININGKMSCNNKDNVLPSSVESKKSSDPSPKKKNKRKGVLYHLKKNLAQETKIVKVAAECIVEPKPPAPQQLSSATKTTTSAPAPSSEVVLVDGVPPAAAAAAASRRHRRNSTDSCDTFDSCYSGHSRMSSSHHHTRSRQRTNRRKESYKEFQQLLLNHSLHQQHQSATISCNTAGHDSESSSEDDDCNIDEDKNKNIQNNTDKKKDKSNNNSNIKKNKQNLNHKLSKYANAKVIAAYVDSKPELWSMLSVNLQPHLTESQCREIATRVVVQLCTGGTDVTGGSSSSRGTKGGTQVGTTGGTKICTTGGTGCNSPMQVTEQAAEDSTVPSSATSSYTAATTTASPSAAESMASSTSVVLIDKKQFYAFQKQFLFDPKGTVDFFHRTVFCAFDADQNGYLDATETKFLLEKVFYTEGSIFRGDARLPSNPDVLLKQLFQTLDVNKDGLFHFEEARPIISGAAFREGLL